jgi:4-hydroxy-tetrahydrodipicolinate reductase
VIRVVVTGAAGRMGGELVRAVSETDGFALVAATERTGEEAVGTDAGVAARRPPLEVPVLDSLEKALGHDCDVVIDFTSPAGSVTHALACAKHHVPIVIGTTGLAPDQRAAILACAREIPVVLAPNMSVGVNLLLKLVAEAARVLGDGYDPEIVELHHKRKKDAPSGTALALAEAVALVSGRDLKKDVRLARQGLIGERGERELGIQAVRGGDVVGEHTVYFFGAGERLELTHRATSRDQFARGAVRAAGWVVGKKPGLYDMQDVLGFR